MNSGFPKFIIVLLLILFAGLAITQQPKHQHTGPNSLVSMRNVGVLAARNESLPSPDCVAERGTESDCGNCVSLETGCLARTGKGDLSAKQYEMDKPVSISGRGIKNNLTNLEPMPCSDVVGEGGGKRGIQCYKTIIQPQASIPPHSLTQITEVLVVLLTAMTSAWLTVWLILKYERLHAHLSHDHVDSGPQKYHEVPTPRIGGLAIIVGLMSAGGMMILLESNLVGREYGLLLLASIPAFFGGLVEDVTKRVGVLERLLLTILAGAIAAWILGAVLRQLEIPIIDSFLTWQPFAVLFTAFAVGGIANAVNIIDGYNGLAGGYAVIVLVALAYIGFQVGDEFIFVTSISLAASLLGFLFWNWPGGRIFLGDGGAYLIGFILAELSVLLVARNSSVSPWFPLLLLVYPVMETFYSIYRRAFRHGLPAGQPDNQHLHQLIHDYLVPKETGIGPRLSRLEFNSRVAKYFWMPTILLAVLAQIYSHSSGVLAFIALVYCVVYIVSYRLISPQDE